MNHGYKYGIPYGGQGDESRLQRAFDAHQAQHEFRPGEGPEAERLLEPTVLYRLTLSNGVLVELLHRRLKGTDDSGTLGLRLTPEGDETGEVNLEGLDLEAFLLIVDKLKPSYIHPAERRIRTKSVKTLKKHEDLGRSNKDLGKAMAHAFVNEVSKLKTPADVNMVPIASEEEHMSEYSLRSCVGVSKAVTIDGERWVVDKVANKLKLTRFDTTADADPETVVIDEKALLADEPLVNVVRRHIAEARKAS
jgi:hypothetical protein